MDSTLVIFWVSRSCHHLIIYSLLWPCWTWWIIADMISWIPWQIFLYEVWSIKLIVSIKFSCFICESCCTIWNSIFHKAKFSFNIYSWFFISSNVNIFDGVLLSETAKCTEWVSSRMSFCASKETLRSMKMIILIRWIK